MSNAVYICRCNTHEINDFIWPFVTVAATEALVGIYLELGQVWSQLFTNVLDYAWKKLCTDIAHRPPKGYHPSLGSISCVTHPL